MLYLYPMAFNRDRNSRSGDRGGFRPRPSFGGRPRFGDSPRFAGGADRGPVEMHSAVCDNCGRECEVPFRPTSGKPVYCSNCFENQRGGSESRNSGRFERRSPEGSENGFAEINTKLDNILMLLENQKPVLEEKKSVKKTKVEEIAPVIE